MSTMNDADRDAFLLERRLGTLATARDGKGPLLAPIWYQYTSGATIDICMSGSPAKAARLRAVGRVSMCVRDKGRPYCYVTAEGLVTVSELGDGARDEIRGWRRATSVRPGALATPRRSLPPTK